MALTGKQSHKKELLKSRDVGISLRYEYLLSTGKSSYECYELLTWEYGLTLDTIKGCITKGRFTRKSK